MGVLNFSRRLQARGGLVEFDLLTLGNNNEETEDFDELEEQTSELCIEGRGKRKRTKSLNKSYDFRDYGVDQRRRGAKHQRRKENFSDLMQWDDGDSEQDRWFEESMTVFTELFLDEKKMKLWEGFMNMSEEKQKCYLDQLTNNEKKSESIVKEEVTEEESSYMAIDKKIRDMLRSKQLAHNALLENFETDMISCVQEEFPSVVVFNYDNKYDRMLIYGLCQYFRLKAKTVKLKNSTLIELELDETRGWKPPEVTLTEYLRRSSN